MTNVLPPDALKAVRRAYRARFIFVGSLIAIVCGVIALLSLMPAYILLRAGHDNSTEESLVSLPASTDRDDIVRAQTLVRELRPVATSTTSALDTLGTVLGVRPAGVKVTSVSFTRGEKGTIIVSGTASSREGINTYRTELAKDPRFKSVSVPIGTLTGSGGGNFAITLTGIF